MTELLENLAPGTTIISILGETARTVESDRAFTGPRARGVIDRFDDAAGAYVIAFEGGISMVLTPAQLADGLRYLIVE
jgi:hypothetical protein